MGNNIPIPNPFPVIHPNEAWIVVSPSCGDQCAKIQAMYNQIRNAGMLARATYIKNFNEVALDPLVQRAYQLTGVPVGHLPLSIRNRGGYPIIRTDVLVGLPQTNEQLVAFLNG